jgi:hypothetical protein
MHQLMQRLGHPFRKKTWAVHRGYKMYLRQCMCTTVFLFNVSTYIQHGMLLSLCAFRNIYACIEFHVLGNLRESLK